MLLTNSSKSSSVIPLDSGYISANNWHDFIDWNFDKKSWSGVFFMSEKRGKSSFKANFSV